MPHVAVSDGVQFTRACTAVELAKSFESLPHEVRYDVARELDARGEAHGYDGVSQFAYYLQRDNTGVLLWTWSPIASYWEAAILLSLIKSLKEPLSEGTAIELLDRATNRRVELVIAPGGIGRRCRKSGGAWSRSDRRFLRPIASGGKFGSSGDRNVSRRGSLRLLVANAGWCGRWECSRPSVVPEIWGAGRL